mgnify:CR=1 FL=1
MKVTIHVLSPLAHGEFGANTGNIVGFRRETVRTADGIVQIPAISGNALRGRMRREIMREMLDACDISRETIPERSWDRLYGALCNGGTLDGAGEPRVSPSELRALRLAIPPLSVFGAALYSRMLSGRCQVGWARLDCVELGTGAELARDLVAEIGTVRHVDGEVYDVAAAGMSPMPVQTETVIAGATMTSRITVRGTELEASVIAHALDLVSTLGGKAGAGLGQVRIEHDGDGSSWVTHLTEHRDGIGAALRELAASLGGPVKQAKGKKPAVAAEPQADGIL